MPNYDYNRGYRWSRFQKDSAIDSSLPPLCSYRLMREMNPLLWVTNAEHAANSIRGHVHSDSGHLRRPSNETSSIYLPIILATSIPTVSEHLPATNTLACSLFSPRTPTVRLGSEETCPHHLTTQKFGIKVTPTRKTRTKPAIRKPACNKEQMNCDSQKKIADCLFIQNGIQCFPSPARRNRFLSTEKERDIKEWINTSAHK